MKSVLYKVYNGRLDGLLDGFKGQNKFFHAVDPREEFFSSWSSWSYKEFIAISDRNSTIMVRFVRGILLGEI